MNFKDYSLWHKIKSWLHNNKPRVFFHEREVWWCSIGLNVGFEQDGKGRDYARPVLIIKGFSKEVFLCVPLTTKNKTNRFYADVDINDGIKRKAILSQIRLIDAKRLQEKIGVVDVLEFKKIKEAIIKLIE